VSETAVMVRESAERGLAGRRAETDAQVVAMWLHGKARNTQRAYAREAAAFSAFVGGAPLTQVTLADVQAYADKLETDGLAPATRARALAAVKSLLTFAHRIGYLPVNVGAAEKLPRIKLTLAERIVGVDVVAALVASETNPRNRTLLRLLYIGGLRVSEVVGLRWRDVQPREDGAQLTVCGKGEATRVVLLPARLAAELEELRGTTGPDDPLFPGRSGALTPGQAWRIVKAAARRAGVPELSPHWLRHAHASHALDAGAGVHVVRDTLGHANLATTSRYLHARPGDSSSRYLATI